MPLYDYRCEHCGAVFEVRHGFNDPSPACPVCGHDQVQRVITAAPGVMHGINANAGSGGTATKEQLRDKWAEETPKLREQLVSKLGEDAVNKYAPTLNTNYDG